MLGPTFFTESSGTCPSIVEILTDQLFLQRSKDSVGNFIFLFMKELLLIPDAN